MACNTNMRLNSSPMLRASKRAARLPSSSRLRMTRSAVTRVVCFMSIFGNLKELRETHFDAGEGSARAPAPLCMIVFRNFARCGPFGAGSKKYGFRWLRLDHRIAGQWRSPARRSLGLDDAEPVAVRPCRVPAS